MAYKALIALCRNAIDDLEMDLISDTSRKEKALRDIIAKLKSGDAALDEKELDALKKLITVEKKDDEMFDDEEWVAKLEKEYGKLGGVVSETEEAGEEAGEEESGTLGEEEEGAEEAEGARPAVAMPRKRIVTLGKV